MKKIPIFIIVVLISILSIIVYSRFRANHNTVISHPIINKLITNNKKNKTPQTRNQQNHNLCQTENQTCGGIGAISCCDGLTCQLDGNYPDASGKCVATKNTDSNNLTCDNLVSTIKNGYGANGPYTVETKTISNPLFLRGKKIAVFFPKGLKGKKPVIFFSHGFGGSDWGNLILN